LAARPQSCQFPRRPVGRSDRGRDVGPQRQVLGAFSADLADDEPRTRLDRTAGQCRRGAAAGRHGCGPTSPARGCSRGNTLVQRPTEGDDRTPRHRHRSPPIPNSCIRRPTIQLAFTVPGHIRTIHRSILPRPTPTSVLRDLLASASAWDFLLSDRYGAGAPSIGPSIGFNWMSTGLTPSIVTGLEQQPASGAAIHPGSA